MKRRGNSGQVLIITSLIVVMLLLAAVIYVEDVQKNVPIYTSESNSVFSAVKIGATHTMISALANITADGSPTILAQDLSEFGLILSHQSLNAILSMNYTLNHILPYNNGVWVSWENDGQGISSAHVSFFLNYLSTDSEQQSEFDVNVTTEINIAGYYVLDGNITHVSVTFTLLNEGTPALANYFTVRYQTNDSSSMGEWINPTYSSIQNFGNGTQLVHFSIANQTRTEPLPVSVYARDLRGVSVMANATAFNLGSGPT